MRIAILTSAFFHDCVEVSRNIDGKIAKGTDKIIYGGAEKYCVDLCHLLQEDGHIVTVYQPFAGISKPFSKQYKGITFVMVPNNGGWEHNTNTDLNWQFNEYSSLDDLRIYFATFLAFPNAISPCITISHGIYWDNTQGVNTVQNMSESTKKEFFRRQMYGFTAPDVCVSVDSNVRKVLQSMNPGSERKTQIIYNYVDTNKFIPAKKTWEGINVLFPRRLTVLRGSTEATKAFINLPQYNFIMAGQAHDDNAAKAFFKSHEHRKNVKFVQKEMDEMPEVYRQADISLVPTISTEGLSLSLLESMSCGLPVITTPVGGLGDAVIPGYNALIYDPNHENLSDYIEVLAEDEETRIKFGKRNREIAVECFDIDIWKARWRNLLAQFGVVPEKQYYIDGASTPHYTAISKIESDSGKVIDIMCKQASKSDKEIENAIKDRFSSQKPKLVAMMLTRNESDRYLERVIENTLLFCDEIVILDDHSTDKTVEVLLSIQTKLINQNQEKRIWIQKANNSWENESELRQELLRHALCYIPNNNDWLIAIDADELYEADKMNEQLPCLMSQTDSGWVGFRFFDMWNDEQHYRDDDIWPAGTSYAPRMFRVKNDMEYKFADRKRHCGSIPLNALDSKGINCPARVKHLGWMKSTDRDKKYLDRMTDDTDNEFYSQEVYDAILEIGTKANLVKWDDNNSWQTPKLTIAYPPSMEWNIMQQRPHHLLKLAASERNRVLFGDDSATGVYEALPYLTVVNGKEFGPFADNIEVDILYVTNPEQMKRCDNIKYKKLIYDCCDWMEGLDKDLIFKADVVLFASKLLYDKIPSLIVHSGQTGTCSVEYYKRFHHQKMIYLPNACDFEHFSKAKEPSLVVPEPIIGYIGCIHPTMVDENIIGALANEFKLLMIGEIKGDFQVITHEGKNSNIYKTGHVKYEHLPEMLSNCKVGIIPFRVDSDYLTHSAPVKVYEYLAAGRPVVASPIPELEPLADMGLIRIVANDDLDGWVKAVELAINEYPNLKGIEWARNQTWKNRWEQFKEGCDIR